MENLDDDDVDIDTDTETVTENIRISAKQSIGYYTIKQHKHDSAKDDQKYSIKVNKPICINYKIQAK